VRNWKNFINGVSLSSNTKDTSIYLDGPTLRLHLK